MVDFPAEFVPNPVNPNERRVTGLRDLLRGGGEQEKLRDERVRMILDHLETLFKPLILDLDDGTARELKIPAPQCVLDATREEGL